MKKIILLFIFPFLIFSCYSSEHYQSQIWGLDKSIVETNLQSRDYRFLETIDFDELEKKNRLQEINRLYNGAGFYLSFVFEKQNQVDNQLKFLKNEMLFGRWRKEAAERIYSVLSMDQKWSQLSGLMSLYISENGSDPDILYYLQESLYLNRQFDKVISYSDSDFASLYSVLSLIEADHIEWKSALDSFIFNGAEAGEIDTLYNSLMDLGQFYTVNENSRLYILAMSSYFHEDYRESGEYFKELNLDVPLLNRYPALFYNLRIPLQRSGQALKWAGHFSSVSHSLENKSSFASSFVSARLYLYKKDYEKADRFFRQAIELATSDFEEDRARWYLMNLYKNNVFHLAGLIEEFAPLWNDSVYFEDILEEYLSLVTARREWVLFLKTFTSVSAYGDKETIAAYSWVKYLAGKSHFIIEEDTEQLLTAMMSSHHLGFYNLMGNLLSGQEPFSRILLETKPEVVKSEIDEMLLGFLSSHLGEEALFYSTGIENQLSDDLLRKLSHYASQSGNHLRSIQLINHVSLKDGFLYTLEDLKLLYPNEYSPDIDFYSRENGFSGEMLSGIIRTESAFTKDIVSYAGAVGLSQLMPETAEEQARKLKIDPLDLTDPETNIQIGSSYIKWITDRPWADNMSQVLIAYNAGGGNLRKWKRVYPGYRDELFAELIPYKETRNYVKKVLTSSIIYGSIYKDLDPSDIVRSIYPDFNELRSMNN